MGFWIRAKSPGCFDPKMFPQQISFMIFFFGPWRAIIFPCQDFPCRAVLIFFRAMIFRAVPCHKSPGPPCRAVPGRPCHASGSHFSGMGQIRAGSLASRSRVPGKGPAHVGPKVGGPTWGPSGPKPKIWDTQKSKK